MKDINKDSFIIGVDSENEYIHVKNPLKECEIKELYKNEYHKDKTAQKIENTFWEETAYSDKFDIFEENFKNKNSKHLLDIGCSIGKFLLYGQKRGWLCKGVEPSLHAYECAKFNNLDVVNSNFTKDIFEKRSFDVIHMHHVLEHLTNPKKIIEDSKELLKDNGVLCLVVPNDFSPFQEILWKKLDFNPWWIAPEHHINYFNFDSLISLLNKSGFDIFLKETSFSMELFLLF
jgi:2-polyprenyl-3-methyl-5-hydroxy-6-metoxy-1,4-benzoquinol methylase